MRHVYLDYNASTPIDPTVAAAIRPFLEDYYGNPSSGHWASIEGKAALEMARSQVAALLGCQNDEVVFTSGGTGSEAWAASVRRRVRSTDLQLPRHPLRSSRRKEVTCLSNQCFRFAGTGPLGFPKRLHLFSYFSFPFR